MLVGPTNRAVCSICDTCVLPVMKHMGGDTKSGLQRKLFPSLKAVLASSSVNSVRFSISLVGVEGVMYGFCSIGRYCVSPIDSYGEF